MPKRKAVKKVFKQSERKALKALRSGEAVKGKRRSPRAQAAALAAAGGPLPKSLVERARRGELVKDAPKAPSRKKLAAVRKKRRQAKVAARRGR